MNYKSAALFIFLLIAANLYSKTTETLQKTFLFSPITQDLSQDLVLCSGYKYTITISNSESIYSGNDSMSLLFINGDELLFSMLIIPHANAEWKGDEKNYIYFPDKNYSKIRLRQYCVGSGAGVLTIIIKREKLNNEYGTKLIGAVVWDGQSVTNSNLELSKNRDGIVERERISELTYQKWAKKKGIKTDCEKGENWRKYCVLKRRLTKGKVLPTDCSFYEVFPKAAKQAGVLYESRQPLKKYHGVKLGWGCSGSIREKRPGENLRKKIYDPFDELVCDNNEQVQAQIDLASEYGIDFFAIYMEVYDQLFNEDGILQTKALKLSNINNFLYQFVLAPNKSKMKYCVCIGGLKENVKDSQRIRSLFEYISGLIESDVSYLRINGEPVVMLYDSNDQLDNFIDNNAIPFKIYNNSPTKRINKDGLWSYSGFVPYIDTDSPSFPYPYKDLAQYNINKCKQYYSGFNTDVIYPVSCGFDVRARYSYIKDDIVSHQISFEKPTQVEFYNTLKTLGDIIDNRIIGDKAICVYAWNEFMEGGWLMPTQAEIDTNDNDRKGFYKLQAIKLFKEYWLNK